MNTYTLKVVDIKIETADCITLCFKQPGLRKIKYVAGQYIALIFRINGRRYVRPYSFSSAPSTDHLLEVTIKRVPNGIVSNHIHDMVKIGDSIETLPPLGSFTCEKENQELYLWGVGSGITPLFSIAKQILSNNDSSRLILIFGNRDHTTTIFFNQLKELSEIHGEKFRIKNFHTKYSINPQIPGLIEGRIDLKNALDILEEFQASPSSIHYICGPVGLKNSVKEALKARGVSNSNIFSEDFELVKDPKDFEEVTTQQIKLRFGPIDHELEVAKGKTILECALDAGIELPYSCQTGDCNICKGNLLDGSVKMIGLKENPPELNEREYLLCCSHPTSSNVYIEIE